MNDEAWHRPEERFPHCWDIWVTLCLSCASFWQVGWYVTIHVSHVPVSVIEHFRQGAPLIAFSLLPYEQKVNQCFVGNGELEILLQGVHFLHIGMIEESE